MKKFIIDYTMRGTIYDYCSVEIEAETKKEAIEYLKSWNWEHIDDPKTHDSDYGDDYSLYSIDEVSEIKE